MPSRQIFMQHNFGGGWATDFGPKANVVPDAAGQVTVPFLVEAEDVLFDLDGGPRLAPGTAKLSAQLESGAAIRGLYDFWITGTTGTPTQHRVCHIGTKIKADDADGSFADIITDMTSGAIPCYSQMNDLLVMVNGADAPQSWDGSSAGDLSGSPPDAPTCVQRHKNRMWMGGDLSTPSRLYYSVELDPEDWAGDGSGFIDIDPDDGDGITGLYSFKEQLIIFKGPNKGSIHIILGSAPTGSDAFSLQNFARGIGAFHQNSIFCFGDDLGWMALDGSVRSLSVTAAYGNYVQGALSRPIQNKWLTVHLNRTQAKKCWATDWPDLGIVLISLPVDGATEASAIIGFDYRFAPARWFNWRSFGTLGGALALVVDPGDSKRQIVMGGGTDGYVRKFGQNTRTIDGGSSEAFKVTFPYLNYGLPQKMKTFVAGSIGLAPKNGGDVTVNWLTEGGVQQSLMLAQGDVGDLLAPADTRQFVLDSSTLGGAAYLERFFEPEAGGEFRSIQFQVLGGAFGEDLEMHSFAAAIELGADSYENV